MGRRGDSMSKWDPNKTNNYKKIKNEIKNLKRITPFLPQWDSSSLCNHKKGFPGKSISVYLLTEADGPEVPPDTEWRQAVAMNPVWLQHDQWAASCTVLKIRRLIAHCWWQYIISYLQGSNRMMLPTKPQAFCTFGTSPGPCFAFKMQIGNRSLLRSGSSGKDSLKKPQQGLHLTWKCLCWCVPKEHAEHK